MPTKYFNLDTDSNFTANSDYYIASQKAIKTALDKKANQENTYTKSEVDVLIATGGGGGGQPIHIPTKVSELENDAGYITANDISSVYKYKGTVEDVDDLPTENNTQGDVYNVLSTGDNYAWIDATDNSEGYWDKLSGSVDLTNYYTKQEVDELFENVPTTGGSELPDQTDNAGKYLTTDGENLSWGDVDALPEQYGNQGKYLTTDGTNAYWTNGLSSTTMFVIRKWDE